MAQLQREIDNWKDKYNKAQDEVRIPKKNPNYYQYVRLYLGLKLGQEKNSQEKGFF